MQQTSLVLDLTYAIAAPPERVYSALTDAGQVASWWGPRGFTTKVLRLDAVAGGSYRYATQPPEGDAFHVAGEFVEFDRPRRLGFTFRYEEPAPDDQETVVTLTLRAQGESTEVALTQQPFATEERLALHRDGWSDSLERLRDLVGQR